jgi:hypothetical protein
MELTLLGLSQIYNVSTPSSLYVGRFELGIN